MASTCAAVWAFFVIYLTCIKGDETCIPSQSFKRLFDLENNSVVETPYVSKPVQHRFECCSQCLDDSLCLTFSYRNGTCSNYKVSPLSSNAAAPGVLYYSKDGDRCPISSGYNSVTFPRLCYKMYNVTIGNWTTSKTRCQAQGGRLVILNTEEKHVHVVTAMNTGFNNNYYSIWVGLHQETIDTFVWSDGSPYIHVWASGEPDNLNYQQCGKIIPNGLSDVECEDFNSYMCEIPLQ